MAAELRLNESCLEVSGQVCCLGADYDGNTVQSLLKRTIFSGRMHANCNTLSFVNVCCRRLISDTAVLVRRILIWRFSSLICPLKAYIDYCSCHLETFIDRAHYL